MTEGLEHDTFLTRSAYEKSYNYSQVFYIGLQKLSQNGTNDICVLV